MSEQKNERGIYRSTHEALADDFEYQDLSPLAQAIMTTLKLKLGQYGISVFYTVILSEVHRKATPAQIEDALQELARPKAGGRGWIVRERNVVWLVNGLRFEPWITLENKNHLAGAKKYAATLPKLAIVEQFKAYYRLREGDTPSHTRGHTRSPDEGIEGDAVTLPPSHPPTHDEVVKEGIQDPSIPSGEASGETRMPSPMVGGNRETETDTEIERETDTKSDAADLEHLTVTPPAGGATASPATQEADLPLEQATKLPRNAARVLLHCYELKAGATPTPRQAQVRRDLELTLTDRGAVLSSGIKVKAVDPEHLDAACEHVLAKPLDRKDAAIRHVLLWLQDTYLETVVAREKAIRGDDPPRAAAPASPVAVGKMLRDQADFEIASTWLQTQPQKVRDTIAADVTRSGANDSSPKSKASLERGLVIAAWRIATASTANVNATREELAHAS